MFDIAEAAAEENYYTDLKAEVGQETETKCGPIEKLTIFENNPDGVIAIKFKQPASAIKCIDLMNKRYFGGKQIECGYWDGITNYKVKESEADSEKRLKEFGDWIEGGDGTAGAPVGAGRS